jgi:hypothetical protein
MSFEHHTSLQATHTPGGSAMAASRGRGYFGGHTSTRSDRGHGRGRGRDHSSHGGYSNSNPKHLCFFNNGSSRPQCQVCLKIGHTTNNRWHRFEEDYVPEPCTAAAATHGADSAWYIDSGSIDHITGNLYKLRMHDPYTGTDQIHAANGPGMDITHIGTFIIPTPTCNLTLNNVLHVPATHKNIISVHCFTFDNDIFIEFHPFFFLIKDQ